MALNSHDEDYFYHCPLTKGKYVRDWSDTFLINSEEEEERENEPFFFLDLTE